MEIKSRLCATRSDAIARLVDLLGTSSPAVAVIPAAGRGERSGLAQPKQYHQLSGTTMLARSIRALARFQHVAAVVVVLHPDDTLWSVSGLDQELADDPRVLAVRIGGASRRDSVLAGCGLVRDALMQLGRIVASGLAKGATDTAADGPDADPWILVHDAARPGLDHESLARLWLAVTSQPPGEQARRPMGGILAMPVADTMKRAKKDALGNDVVAETLDRSTLWAAQTPQMFSLQALLTAYANSPLATDEASAVEAAGGQVLLVKGDSRNLKLTQPDDFRLMEAVMAQDVPFAVGQGFDVHALVSGRPLIIGGVTIPYEKGLDGHSDADVLLHAITDAILGAAAMGDIGRHFPDTDPAFKGADSKLLLAEAVRRVRERGWRVAQIDATIIAQAPKISPYAPQMQAAIAACCDLSAELINIKGKTTERLGFTGRGEGIAAQAIAMLVRRSA